jgi:hypothetical protein
MRTYRKRRPKIITAKWLVKLDACEDVCKGFAKRYPDGLEVTRANVHRVSRNKWCYDALWLFADRYLSKKEWAIYAKNGDPWLEDDRVIKRHLLEALGL